MKKLVRYAWFPYMYLQDAQWRSMPYNAWTPMLTSNPSLRNNSLRASNKVAHVELLPGNARPVLQYAVTGPVESDKEGQKKTSVF